MATLKTALSKSTVKITETAPIAAGTIVYENTYRMKPDTKFKAEAVQQKLNEILQNRLKGVTYSDATADTLSQSLSAEILTEVKSKSKTNKNSISNDINWLLMYQSQNQKAKEYETAADVYGTQPQIPTAQFLTKTQL